MHQQDPQLSGFISDQFQIITSFWSKQYAAVIQQYENAKAKLQAVLGEFLQNKARLNNMARRLNYLADKADKTGNAALRRVVTDAATEVERTRLNQVSLEGKLQTVFKRLGAIESSKPEAGSLSQDPIVTPTVVIAVVAAVAVVTGLVVIHNKKVNYLERLLTDVEKKVLSPSEAAALGKGAQLFGDVLGDPKVWLIGGLGLVGAWWFFMRRR